MKANNTLSPYTLAWVEVRPTKGIVTKKDIEKMTKYRSERHRDPNGNFYISFYNEARAKSWRYEMRNANLTKAYECRVFTDKQFGMRSESDNYAVHFTAKQNEEMILIGMK